MILTENLFCNTYSLNSQNQRKRETADLAGIFEPSWFSSIAKKSFQQNKTKKTYLNYRYMFAKETNWDGSKIPVRNFEYDNSKLLQEILHTRLLHTISTRTLLLHSSRLIWVWEPYKRKIRESQILKESSVPSMKKKQRKTLNWPSSWTLWSWSGKCLSLQPMNTLSVSLTARTK